MKKIIMLSGFSLVLSACTQSTPAEITDISNMTSSSEIVSSSYIEPPKNISSGNQGFLTQPRVTSADIESPDMSSSEFTSSDVAPSELDSSETPPSRRTSSERVLSETTSSDADNNKIITTREQISYNRNYEDIPKGGYQGNSYQVKRGDTLFYIAWVTGNDYRALASKNNIPEPYALREGQVLNVGGGETVVVTEKKTTQAEINKQNSMKAASKTASTAKTTTNTSKTPTTSSTVDNVSWRWPARGRVIEKFSKATKGIDIAGTLGDRVSSAADGRVVYAGNALPGYGNLIIIKHNDDYLTAYAHNQTMLVKEQQAVKAGQQIATMGATGTSSVRLHFEIRYRAESVNPLKYLPGR